MTPCWVLTTTQGWVKGEIVRWQLGWRGYQAPVVAYLDRRGTVARGLVRKRDPALKGEDRPT